MNRRALDWLKQIVWLVGACGTFYLWHCCEQVLSSWSDMPTGVLG